MGKGVTRGVKLVGKFDYPILETSLEVTPFLYLYDLRYH